MAKIVKILISLSTILVLLAGCEADRKKPATESGKQTSIEVTTSVLLQEPVPTSRVETATEALGLWRELAKEKPALIMFSSEPYLMPVPMELESEAIRIVREGSKEEIKIRAVDITPNPLLLHQMAVDVALKADFFSELIWIMPHDEKNPATNLNNVKENLLKLGWISQVEHSSLKEKEGVLHGKLRNIPVRIGHSSNIPDMTAPAFVHFDLGYFKPFYKNEVKTPIYSVILAELTKIKEKGFHAIGASVSCSNLGKEMPLDVRFLGGDLTTILNTPSTIDTGMPKLWAQRSENIYLVNFFATERIKQNLKEMNKVAPDDATVKFQSYRYHSGKAALDYLAEAVAIDPMYALEYLDLSQIALEKGRPDAAVTMLENAKAEFPDNPIISMSMAELQLMIGHRSEALKLIDQLKSLPWSKQYDPNMQTRLDRMAESAQQLKVSPTEQKGQ